VSCWLISDVAGGGKSSAAADAACAAAASTPYLSINADGTFGVRHELATDTFLHDCAAEGVAPAHARQTWQSVAVTAQPVSAAAWQQINTTYLVCADDRGTPPEAQREQARRAAHVVEVDAGHHVFLSQPRAVADLILTLR